MYNSQKECLKLAVSSSLNSDDKPESDSDYYRISSSFVSSQVTLFDAVNSLSDDLEDVVSQRCKLKVENFVKTEEINDLGLKSNQLDHSITIDCNNKLSGNLASDVCSLDVGDGAEQHNNDETTVGVTLIVNEMKKICGDCLFGKRCCDRIIILYRCSNVGFNTHVRVRVTSIPSLLNSGIGTVIQISVETQRFRSVAPFTESSCDRRL